MVNYSKKYNIFYFDVNNINYEILFEYLNHEKVYINQNDTLLDLSNKCNNSDIIVIDTIFLSNISNNVLNIDQSTIFEILNKYSKKIIIFDNINKNYHTDITTLCVNASIHVNDKLLYNNSILFPSIIYKYKILESNISDVLSTVNTKISNTTLIDLNNKELCCQIINDDILSNTDIYSEIFQSLKNLNISVININNKNALIKVISKIINIRTLYNSFIFCILSTNLSDNTNYISNILFDICLSGAIPVYYGNLSFIDENFFNMNRIICYNYSIDNNISDQHNDYVSILSSKIKTLMNDPIKLHEFYLQYPFNVNAKTYINNMLKEWSNCIITNLSLKQLKNTNYMLTYLDVINTNQDIIVNNESNIIVVLTTTLANIKTTEFKIFIDSLNSQTLKPKYILIKVIIEEDLAYTIINNDYPNLIINCYKSNYLDNESSLSDLENLFNIQDKLDPLDIIVFITDKFNIKSNFLLMYKLCYELYRCDGVIMSYYKTNILFWDNYQGSLQITKSYSFKFSSIQHIKITDLTVSLDTLFTNWYKNNKLYLCGINNNINCEDTNDINLQPITEFKLIQDHEFVIPERQLLYNVENIHFEYTKDIIDNYYIDIKYFNKNILIVTITSFNNKKSLDKLTININNCFIDINNIEKDKYSFFIYCNKTFIKEEHFSTQVDIIQFNKTSIVSKYEFYKTCIILSNIPSFTYKLITDNDIIKYTQSQCILNTIYNMTYDNNIKLDIIRAWYLAKYGGLYIQFNSILYKSIKSLVYTKDFYVLNTILPDTDIKKINMSFIYSSYKLNPIMVIYLINICVNIFNNEYLSSYYEISNHLLLENIIYKYDHNKNDCDRELFSNYNYKDFYYIKQNNNILFKIPYYDNNTSLWSYKQLYKNINCNYNLINGIDHIIWINMDSSVYRKEYMMSLFNNHLIPNTRISGVDDKYEISYINSLISNDSLSLEEKRCYLAHIKAINYLNNISGNYFLICEDDININNIMLSPYDLKTIISNSPEFDILLLYKYIEDMNILINLPTYITFEDLQNKYNIELGSTACYIITRSGINKIIEQCKYDYITDKFIIDRNVTTVIDNDMRRICKTVSYKYNFIGQKSGIDNINFTSTIHTNHEKFHKICNNNNLEITINDYIFL